MTVRQEIRDYMEGRNDDQLGIVFHNATMYSDEELIAALDVVNLRGLSPAGKTEVEERMRKMHGWEPQAVVHLPIGQAKAIGLGEANLAVDHGLLPDDIYKRLPQLFGREAVFGFSFVFSALAGAFLIIANMVALKRNNGGWQALLFAIGYTVLAGLMIASAQSKVELIFLSVAMNLNGAFLMSNFMWRRVIGRGVIYRERTIGIPLLIALAFVAAAIILFRYV